MCKTKYGDFHYGKKEFIITTPDIPRNWYNYMWNDSFLSFVSQTASGQAFVQDSLGCRIPLISGRAFYILEGDDSWGISGLPVSQKNDCYFCIHGLGYTIIHTLKNGIQTELCFFVPAGQNCELCLFTVKNISNRKRNLKFLACNTTEVDGVYTPQGYNLSAADIDQRINGIFTFAHREFNKEKKHPFYAFMSMSQEPDGYDAAYNSFIGPYGSLSHPIALEGRGCFNTPCIGEKLIFALEKNISLEAGDKRNLVVITGVSFQWDQLLKMKNEFADPLRAENAMEEAKGHFREQIRGVQIRTPDKKLNEMFPWLKHQANLGSRWARVRHNGYRDMTSDCDCLAAVNPHLALKRFRRILSYQYANGYAPRTIRDGKICDNFFSDNMVWIPFTALSILKELGDVSILDEKVKFNDDSEGSIYEHIKRSVDFLYGFRGLHGLIRIWGGDWNDCMNTAGLEGKGVSVWLSIAWYRANKEFGEIAKIYGRDEDVAVSFARGEELQDIIEKYGWDGEYYLDAYNDDGFKIGSHVNEQGKIYLIPQLWAVLSGVSRNGREKKAMEAVEKYLSSELGTLISAPPYTKYDPGIGDVTLKPAGVHENGGVYLHAIAWKIAADAVLKRPDKIAEDMEAILPFRNKIVKGRAEPYVMCNSYFGKQTAYRYGTPGQSWRTAAGPWLEKALIYYVYGLKPEMEGLRLEPCLPISWKKAEITKNFRGALYRVSYKNNGAAVKRILVNGALLTGDILPYEKGKSYFVEVITE